MARPPHVRRFLQGRPRVLESYRACWHAFGIFQERLCVRMDRYRDCCEIVGQVFELVESGDWQPAQKLARLLTPAECDEVSAWVEAGFWGQPCRDHAGAVMDGDSWLIEGYRAGEYRRVYRHTGSAINGTGTEVYELGKRLARLAGLRRFEGMQEG